jgi:hypothetical protein
MAFYWNRITTGHKTLATIRPQARAKVKNKLKPKNENLSQHQYDQTCPIAREN